MAEQLVGQPHGRIPLAQLDETLHGRHRKPPSQLGDPALLSQSDSSLVRLQRGGWSFELTDRAWAQLEPLLP